MKDKYFVVSGNEYGLDMLGEIIFISKDEALIVFNRLIEEHFVVVMYKVEEDRIISVKEKIYE